MPNNQSDRHTKPWPNLGLHSPVASKPPPLPSSDVTATTPGAKEPGTMKSATSNKKQDDPSSIVDQTSPTVEHARKEAMKGDKESNNSFSITSGIDMKSSRHPYSPGP